LVAASFAAGFVGGGPGPGGSYPSYAAEYGQSIVLREFDRWA